MIPSRFYPVDAKLFTWECTSSFDESPSMKELRDSFEKEFPKMCGRLMKSGGLYRLLHLVSFNSTEGRRSRYLVVVLENPLPSVRKRVLPKQVAVLAAADRSLREQASAEDNSGNFLCYAAGEKILDVLIFFEGRLCHWTEYALVEMSPECIESKLRLFRRFLKNDALFSRGESFAEIQVAPVLPGDSKRAARDPFWKRIDLRRESLEPQRKGNWKRLVALLILVVACWKVFLPMLCLKSSHPLRDVLPVELDAPPAWSESAEVEPVAETPLRNTAAKVARCVLPDFKLKGVVAAKLIVAEVEGVSSVVLLGDSLGSFRLHSIGRDGVDLVCGDSLVRWGVFHARF